MVKSQAPALQAVWLDKKVTEVTLPCEGTSVHEPWGHTEKLSPTLLPFFGGGNRCRNGLLNGLGYLACLVPLFPPEVLKIRISRRWASTIQLAFWNIIDHHFLPDPDSSGH